MTTREIHNHLIAHGIKPFPHKVAIMQYLQTHHTHPTSDQIYNDLLPDLPTLSKTTVYNTLKLFCDKKVAIALFIDEKNVRYDACMHTHAHFRCKHCNAIYEVPLEETDIPQCRSSEEIYPEETQIYFLGKCKECN